jgi:hypothetical protein
LDSIRQHPEENIRTFWFRFNALYAQVFSKVDPQHLIFHFVTKLKSDDLKKKLYEYQSLNLDDFLMKAIKLESKMKSTNSASALNINTSSTDEEIRVLKDTVNYLAAIVGKKISCYNCGKPGHLAKDCRFRRVYGRGRGRLQQREKDY